LKVLKEVVGNEYFIIGTVCANIGIPDGNNINEYVIDLYENPDIIKSKSEDILKNAINYQYRQIEAGADTVVNACDVAFNNGPFISPAFMDEFFFPYFIRWVESLKSQGRYTIWHTDGNLYPIMDRILESGVTAIQCVDPLGGMDIVELMEQVEGKLALIGNVNCSLLATGPVKEIEKEVRRVVEGCKDRAGFVLSGCNAIFNGIPAEHYNVMVETRRSYEKIPLIK
jgi:uroporphyrinogen decarboxylase